jgi:ABC-2 type transport system permease protein
VSRHPARDLGKQTLSQRVAAPGRGADRTRETDSNGPVIGRGGPPARWAKAAAETRTLAARTLRHSLRSPDTIMTVVATPVMLLLAFVYVLGGAMDTGPVRYVDFVTPTVLLFCVASGVAYTALRVNADVSRGLFDRFRTMPIARGAIVAGHVVASVVANAVSVGIVAAAALLVGYRPRASLPAWAATLGLVLLTLLAFTLVGVAFGLLARSAEGAGLFSYLLIGLLFVSSGFVPTATMPAPLRAFADHQPMTAVVNALRSQQLGLGDASGSGAWAAATWLAAIAAAFSLVAAWATGHQRR